MDPKEKIRNEIKDKLEAQLKAGEIQGYSIRDSLTNPEIMDITIRLTPPNNINIDTIKL